MNNYLRSRNFRKTKALTRKALLPLAVAGLGSAASSPAFAVDECGYNVTSGVTTSTRFGYIAWVDINNVSGDAASEFEVLLDTGDTSVQWVVKGDYEDAGDGDYWVTQPRWWRNWKDVDQGESYRFRFRATPQLDYIAPYLVSINGMPCDTLPPTIALSASDAFLTSADELMLTADVSDNAAVMKVVFERDGEVIGEDTEAPFELPIPIDASNNGYQLYTATAYDPSGNSAESAAERVFVAIDNQFIGTAPGGPESYVDLLTYFNQLTPENAGKWGSVESERDVMNWEALDTAYQFAKDNDIAFKFHTLVWGQQQPAWLDSLSPAEQLEEIEEWMSLVAARYPDLKMIEVVNEPLHAPPSYAEALGGAGATGWDWVLKSFELAREYFPDAQLMLNDYNILIWQDFTADYLDIITPLQAAGLIDAIGLQSHFLEQAELPIVAENLDTLAATGLPLYISEFDLNIANDALHANKFRDLFTLFWEHPAVVGVTHWGHLEGRVWQDDSHLINADGSPRPALDWMTCYLAGNSECTVPEYVPTGWQGDEFGLTLEAETYDAGQGVLALGENVAYTDDGDWIAFYGVEFQAGWDSFWVSYAKGNTETGSISVHFDDPESPAIVTVELPPTAGWGTTEEIEVPWLAGDVTHDVYIRFNDTYGVANLDSVRFGKPEPTTSYGPNILQNGTFDYGDYWWFTWSGSIEHATDVAYAGPGSLKIVNPDGGGLAATDVLDAVQIGASYQVNMFASVTGAATAPVRLVSSINCGAGDAYTWVIPNVTVSEGGWTEMSGVLDIPSDCADLSKVQLFVEGPGAGIDYYIDEVSVREILSDGPASIFPNGDFEAGNTDGWYTWGGGTIATTTDHVNGGSYALEAVGGPAAFNLIPVVDASTTYSVSMAVSVQGIASDSANIELASRCESSSSTEYIWVTNPLTIAEGEWATLEGTITVPECELGQLQLYVAGPAEGALYLDDVQLIQQ